MSGNLGGMLKRPSNSLFLLKSSLIWFSKRHVYTQNVLFGTANEINYKYVLNKGLSCGPSIIMGAWEYDKNIYFETDSRAIQKNDDLTRLFGLNKLDQVPVIYKDYPKNIMQSIMERNGICFASFQFSKKDRQWTPDKLITSICKIGLDNFLNLGTDELFYSYLKNRNATVDDIANMYSAAFVKNVMYLPEKEKEDYYKGFFVDGDPGKGIQPEKLEDYVQKIEKADVTLPSFTDIEFVMFFLNSPEAEQNYIACLVNGEHFIPTKTVSQYLKDLLALKQADDDIGYRKKLAEFLTLTSGNSEVPSRTSRIVDAFRIFPAFEYIFAQNSDFMSSNFELLCAKIDSYLLNLVKPSESLVVNLQFPYVLGEAPLFITLLIGNDAEGNLVIRELLTDSKDPLSITAKKLDSRIANSLKYGGTPSANICILENPEELEKILAEVTTDLWAKNAKETSDTKMFINRLNALFSVFSDPAAKLKYLNGKRLSFSAKGNGWKEQQQVISVSGLLNMKMQEKETPVKTYVVDDFIPTDGGGIVQKQTVVDEQALENYFWIPSWSVELNERFKAKKSLNRLPMDYPLPSFYPEHVGAASPLNPISTSWKSPTYEEFNKLMAKS
ncbi:MAG: hypothetical protein CMN55_11475 [Sneathiella sp.]|jgi:hypothetical protein|uniref:hypothetical protein n=1 Tax=Sneathiella sp. TaxID=1964365 RepID=UPI000C3EF990|nr:hypothetical protein [Sneathiella sp.]MAL79712.1 hypothetical protein [Sneathiella sp.]|tara:strand:+ start:249 stop:2087 length:1839 start_codon:yes stop_codon:yes gene_type:complete